MSNISFEVECEVCGGEFIADVFIEVCKGCRNKCSQCGKRGAMNFEEFDYGVRCSKHKEDGMINTQSKEYGEKRFIKRITELGGKVIGEYEKSNKPVECICSNNHKCRPIPSSIQRGQGMCRVCTGLDPDTAKNNFINRITELGGTVVGEYRGKDIQVECICPNGHPCRPIPSSIRQGRGMCRVCVGKDPDTAKTNFIKRITELGGRVVGEYERNDKPVECICPNGHPCRPMPSSIRDGRGMCRVCAGKDPDTARTNFIKQITELGGKVVGEYERNDKPVECICPNGHPCRPRPGGIRSGQGMCRVCAGKDPDTTRTNFIKQITELGGTVVGEYERADKPVECICPSGHPCRPMPSSIQQGEECVGYVLVTIQRLLKPTLSNE